MDEKEQQMITSKIHSNTVYCLSGIPSTIEGQATTKNDAHALMVRAWPYLRDANIRIRTLQADHQNSEKLTATLNFIDTDNLAETAVKPVDVQIAAEGEDGDGTEVCLRLTSDFLTEAQKTNLRYLSFPYQNHRESEVNVAAGTCDWILEHQSFRDWLSIPHKLLCIRGASGAGKSHVVKRITQHLRETQSVDGPLVLSYFFDGHHDGLHKSHAGFYRHLLTQVLPDDPHGLEGMVRQAEKIRSGAPGSDLSVVVNLLPDHCMNIMYEMMRKVPLTIVVDVLADVATSEVVFTLHGLLSAAKREKCDVRICVSSCPAEIEPDFTINVEEHNQEDIRKVVHQELDCSRDQQNAYDQEDMQQIELEETIQQKANGGFQWATSVAKELSRLQRSGKDSPALMRNLSNYPPDLDQLYGNFLEQLDAKERPETIKLFQWMCFSQRPLSPIEMQYALAFDKETSVTSMKGFHTGLKVMDARTVEKWVERQSRRLAKVRRIQDQSQFGTPTSYRVQFVHQSVADYLSLRGGLQRFIQGTVAFMEVDGLLQKDSKTHPTPVMAQSCVRYLRMNETVEETKEKMDFAETLLEMDLKIKAGELMTSTDVLDLWIKMETIADAWNLEPATGGNKADIEKLSPSEARSFVEAELFRLAKSINQKAVEKYPFADYVIHSLNHHLKSLDAGGSWCDDFVNTTTTIPGQGSIFDSWRYLSICLHMARPPTSLFDPPSPDATPPRRTTTLHYIARHNLLSSLEPALSSAPPTSLSLHDDAGATPLITAIQNSHYALATTLVNTTLSNPLHINTPDNLPTSHQPPLTHALRRHKRHRDPQAPPLLDDLITALIAHPHIDPSLPDASALTPLHHAASLGHTAALTPLLSLHQPRSLPLDAPDAAGRTPLHHACRSGVPSSALAILDAAGPRAPPLDGPDAHGRAPLSYAAEAGAAAVVERLLGTAASVDVARVDGAGVDALGYAVGRGRARVVRALVRAGAGAGAGVGLSLGVGRREVLEWAVGRGEVVLVRGVLEAGEEEEGWCGYVGEGMLRRIRGMVGEEVEERGMTRWVGVEGEDGETRLVGMQGEEIEEPGPVEEARKWLRQNLGRFETKTGNLAEIKRLMEERKRKKEREQKEKLARMNQGPGEKITSRL